MSSSTNSPLTPDAALHAFMDGELDTVYEQSLFNELASSKDLRSEMKDVISIRGSVQQDIVAPPADGEAALLAGLGFTTGGAAAGAAGGGAAVGAGAAGAVGSITAMKAILYSLGSLIAGFAIAFLFFYPGTSENNSTNLAASDVSSAGGSAVAGRTPDAPTQGLPDPIPVRVDTVYAVKFVSRPVPVLEEQLNDETELEIQEADNSVEEEISNPTPTYLVASSADLRQPAVSDLQTTSAMSNAMLSRDQLTYASLERDAIPVMLRVRTLASGLPSDEATPNSVQDAFLPNSAIAIMYPLAEGHKLGFEMGTESFRQVFTSSEDGRPVTYTQTPVLFWMGGTYTFTPEEFSFLDGLSPFATVTGGVAYSQGPVGRATVGLAYQPVGPLRFTLGIDGSSLMYQHNNAWFFSNKLGVSYGISFDIGKAR